MRVHGHQTYVGELRILELGSLVHVHVHADDDDVSSTFYLLSNVALARSGCPSRVYGCVYQTPQATCQHIAMSVSRDWGFTLL